MRSSIAAIALFASAVLAGKPAETVYTTVVDTITSCGPEVTNCPAKSHSSTAAPYSISANATGWSTSTIYSTTLITVTSCAATVTDCPAHSTVVVTSVIPVSTTVCPITAETTPYAYSTGKYSKSVKYTSSTPIAPVSETTTSSCSETLSTKYVSTCIPTVLTEVVTVTPTKSYPSVYPSGTGAWGKKNSTSTYPPIATFTGAASSVQGSMAVAGLAVLGAIILA